MNTLLLEVEGLTKEYENYSLGPIDFKVEAGMIVGLVGANGSGKSTFFRVLMRVIQEDKGRIEFFGKDLHTNETEIKQNIGYVGELLDVYEYLTIEELASLIYYWYPSWNKDRFEYLAKRYEINKKEKYGKCSKGTKKKVEFIFSLCPDSWLLLLDEPTAGVDIVSQRKIKEDLMKYMDDGDKAIVLATHNTEELNQLCDSIYVLRHGKISDTLNKDDIYENWSRVWVSRIPETIKNHISIINTSLTPPQIVTNNIQSVEEFLKKEEITINHTQRLSLEEVLEYLIE
ncbi:ABC transporter ATP-binding protein [Oceanobacillus halophilus]|nr:ABC transporter ATP-binding protein [Oceanobacillus halophilus]